MRKGTERFLKISKLVLDNHDSLRYDIRVAAEKNLKRSGTDGLPDRRPEQRILRDLL